MQEQRRREQVECCGGSCDSGVPLLSGRRLIVNGGPSGRGHAHSGPTPRPGFAETSLNKYQAIPRPPQSLPHYLSRKNTASRLACAPGVYLFYICYLVCTTVTNSHIQSYTPESLIFLTRLFDVYDLKIGSRSEVNFSNVPQCIISGKASQISLAIN